MGQQRHQFGSAPGMGQEQPDWMEGLERRRERLQMGRMKQRRMTEWACNRCFTTNYMKHSACRRCRLARAGTERLVPGTQDRAMQQHQQVTPGQQPEQFPPLGVPGQHQQNLK